jgi:hypothetical protein
MDASASRELWRQTHCHLVIIDPSAVDGEPVGQPAA